MGERESDRVFPLLFYSCQCQIKLNAESWILPQCRISSQPAQQSYSLPVLLVIAAAAAADEEEEKENDRAKEPITLPLHTHFADTGCVCVWIDGELLLITRLERESEGIAAWKWPTFSV